MSSTAECCILSLVAVFECWREFLWRGVFLGCHAKFHACVTAWCAGTVHVDPDIWVEF